MRYLHFGSVRGDLQEGNGCASRCQFPHFPSTKSPFLCAFWLQNPRFRAFRAQNRGLCALWGSGTPIFRVFEHKIRVFVRFWPSGPPFSGISSTKSPFLCSFTKMDVGLGRFPADRGIVAPAEPILPLTLPPLHLRSRCTCAAAAPAQPLYLPSRRICAAAVPSAVACSRLSPVPPVLPLLPPLHLLSRFTCGAAAPAQPILPQPTAAAPALPMCQLPLPVAAAYHRCT